MAKTPKRDDQDERPRIWVEGRQRPPFDFRALARVSLFFARNAAAFVYSALARWGRRLALKVRDGAGRIPAAKLGRVAPYVPSHLRVAMWIRNLAAILAHASATADPDVNRGNALVTGIEETLWPEADPGGPLPPQPGQAAAMAIQIIGYLKGWAGAIIVLPYGLARALWAYAAGQDLRKIGREA